MATSLSAQLQSVRSVTKISSATPKRPITRSSIIFSPKEAADIDIDTIFTIALSGLEVLVATEARFRNYKNDLFSHSSKELDRELCSERECERINTSIGSYLRLLSGYLEFAGSLKTLEYLIRRYMVHVYNVEDLILCALPYHDTHMFVQIVQLLDIRNGKWKFLEGVKASGAPPPRNVLVQQCIRDMGVLEAICNYGTPAKKYQPSRPVVSLCTAVVMEVLGSSTIFDTDFIKRLFPFVTSGLQRRVIGSSDHKASALMVISLISNKVSLSSKLVKSLLRSISEIALEDAEDSSNLQWLRFSLMALINVVQLQHVDLLPIRLLQNLKEIRNVIEILAQLSREYNIDKFLNVVLESLIEYSFSDDSFHLFLLSFIETIPTENIVCHLTSKILSSCWRASQNNNIATMPSGNWLSKTMKVVNAKYPSLFHQAVETFLHDNKLQTETGEPMFETLCKMLGEGLGESFYLSDSKTWFSLHHPKVEIRRAALCRLNNSLLTRGDESLEMVPDLKDMILRQLHDCDLTVVQAALSIKEVNKFVTSSELIKTSNAILERCINVMMSSSPDGIALAYEVAILFLNIAVSSLNNDADLVRTLAAAMFPALLVSIKTQRLNLKVLEFGKMMDWSLYQNLVALPLTENRLQPENVTELNMEIVDSLAETFFASPNTYIDWFISTSHQSNAAMSLFFLVLMQTLIRGKDERDKLNAIFDATFSIICLEWKVLDTSEGSIVEVGSGLLQWDCKNFLDQLGNVDTMTLNRTILVCIFWRLLEGLVKMRPEDDLLMDNYNKVLGNRLRELFTLFASSVKKTVFQEHLHFISKNCNVSPADFLTYFFTQEDVSVPVLVESLKYFAFICSDADDALLHQVLANLPSLFVPLASDHQDVKVAAMNCIEEFCLFSHRAHRFSKKNGNIASWYNFLDDLLKAIIQQKRLILSERSFLRSFLASLLGSPSNGLRVATNVEHRFDEASKENIIRFVLHYSLQLSDFSKLTILSLLKGLGPKILLVKVVEELLTQLLNRRSCILEMNETFPKLTETEVKILCTLLEICAMPLSMKDSTYDSFLLRALHLDGLPVDKFYVTEPCISSLRILNNQFFRRLTAEKQELFFRALVPLYSSSKVDIQSEAREALLRLNISSSVVLGTLEFICKLESSKFLSSMGKKMKAGQRIAVSNLSPICGNEISIPSLSSLLDILILKKDISGRQLLIGPLFDILRMVRLNQSSLDTLPETLYFLKQTFFLVLEDIIGSVGLIEDEAATGIDIILLSGYARSEKDAVTRNHILSLLTTIAKVAPEKILNHLVDILTVIGESAITQSDSYSQRMFEEFVAAVIPCWLASTNNPEELLKIFIHVLPEVADHRRLSIMVFVLRNMGEQTSLAPFLVLLFHSLVERNGVVDKMKSSTEVTLDLGVWEYLFAKQISEQYSCLIWLPSLVSFLQQMADAKFGNKTLLELMYALEFVGDKLHDPELALKFESRDDSDRIDKTFQNLMEHVISISMFVDSKGKKKTTSSYIQKEANKVAAKVLRLITTNIAPSAYFRGITNLLDHPDVLVKRKVLIFLSDTIKGHRSAVTTNKGTRDAGSKSGNDWFHFGEVTRNVYANMCLEIVKIIDTEDEASFAVKSSAVATVESLVQTFPSNDDIYGLCLASIAKSINSSSLVIMSSCLRATGVLLHALGLKSLSVLPIIMENLFSKLSDVSKYSEGANISDCQDGTSKVSKECILLSTLATLEAVVDKLGDFLNPYLCNIIELLVLRSEYTSAATGKLKQRADGVRRLLTEKISMRLVLSPLTKICSDLISSGASNLTITFQMLENFVSRMDRSSVVAHYKKVFEFCLNALELRSQHIESIQPIDLVEQSVVSAIISLSMKLTETMFKPIFIKVIEWSELSVGDNVVASWAFLDRKISFYHLVNKLAESHRSLFVPYFKYLLESCVQHLTSVGDDDSSGLSRKKKKAKIQSDKNGTIMVLGWHLRALIISALHKCFLYDAGAVKFLDSSNFQQLLKPIVSQLAIEPPASMEDHSLIPSVNEVDDQLVLCIGQMAVDAGTDLLWKPLNHEVLLQTRSEKVRTRILGLRIVKYFLDHLKEEYLVLLPETLPFLAELLEDVELQVKSLAQDIIKEMESLSGESLRQYLL